MQMLKQLGGWRSDAVAQGYVEHSMHTKNIILDRIVQASESKNPQNLQSGSKKDNSAINNCQSEENDVEVGLYDEDFDDFNLENLHAERLQKSDAKENSLLNVKANQVPTSTIQEFRNAKSLMDNSAVVCLDKTVTSPVLNTSTGLSCTKYRQRTFFKKKPVKLNFLKPECVESKKKKIDFAENIDSDEAVHQEDIFLKKPVKFENCTFHHCTFNLT